MRKFKLVTNGGYCFAKVGQIAELVAEDRGFLLRHDEWPSHGSRGDKTWRFIEGEVEEVMPEVVAPPKFKVGDKVRIMVPSQIGGDARRGEVAEVEFMPSYRGGPWYNVTRKPGSPYCTYHETSLEAAAATPAPYIVMLRGKDGRLAPSSHPAEHTDWLHVNYEAARLAKRHGQRFEIWQQVAVVEPPAIQSPIIAAMHARETAVLTHNGVSQSVVVNSYDFNTSEYLLDMTAKIRVVGEPRIGGTK